MKLEQKSKTIISELVLRLCATSALSYFFVNAVTAWISNPSHYTLLALVASEALTTYFLLTAKIPTARDYRPATVIATNIATFYFLFLSLDTGSRLISESAATTIQITGLVWQVFSKLSLGRSFGLLPAHRSIVSNGAYKFVRHPIYLGYFIAHLGFLLANFCMQNCLILLALYLTQAFRILKEEELLQQHTQYAEYRNKVKYRMIPLVF